MIKSVASFLIPPPFVAVDPFIAPPLRDKLMSDCSLKNVGELSCPPEIMHIIFFSTLNLGEIKTVPPLSGPLSFCVLFY